MVSVPFHGNIDEHDSNISPHIAHFPKWDVNSIDGAWCTAFVYHCFIEAGYEIPYSSNECVSCSLVSYGEWDEFAQWDSQIGYFQT